MSKHQHNRKPSLLWPLLLIGLGVILLLSNLGILPDTSINLLWRFWPLIFIIIGIDLLIGQRSTLGAIFAMLLGVVLIAGAVVFSLFAQNTPAITNRIDLGQVKQEQIQAARQEVSQAEVFIDWSTGTATLSALNDSNDLIQGNVTYQGNLQFDVNRNGSFAEVILDSRSGGMVITEPDRDLDWDVRLHPDVALDLRLDASSGDSTYDLSQFTLTYLEIDASSGDMVVLLPEQGQIRGAIDGSSGQLQLTLPSNMEAKLTIETGSGSVESGERFRPGQADDEDEIVLLTPDYEGAENYIDLYIDQGSGTIRID